MPDTINFVDGQVQVCFTKGEEPLRFGDELWMAQADYDALTPDDIEDMKQARYDNWLAIVGGTQ